MSQSLSTTIKIGDEVVVDMSKMVGFGSYIADGNGGSPVVVIRVTQVDADGEQGFGVARSLLPIGGHDILWTRASLVEQDDETVVRHRDGLVYLAG